MVEKCNHKFKVDRVFEGNPVAQILICKLCNQKFFGYDGKVGSPLFVHEVNKPIEEKQIDKILSINLDLKEE